MKWIDAWIRRCTIESFIHSFISPIRSQLLRRADRHVFSRTRTAKSLKWGTVPVVHRERTKAQRSNVIRIDQHKRRVRIYEGERQAQASYIKEIKLPLRLCSARNQCCTRPGQTGGSQGPWSDPRVRLGSMVVGGQRFIPDFHVSTDIFSNHFLFVTFNSIVVGHKCICPFHSFFPSVLIPETEVRLPSLNFIPFSFTHLSNVPSPRARLVTIVYTVLISETEPAS